jgi:hypothetical protein
VAVGSGRSRRSASAANSLSPISSNLFGRPFLRNMIRRCSPRSSRAGAPGSLYRRL